MVRAASCLHSSNSLNSLTAFFAFLTTFCDASDTNGVDEEGANAFSIRLVRFFTEVLSLVVVSLIVCMLYKDTCNRKSNQQNLGTIKSSNLCSEIVEYTSPDEVAVCNLASIGLARFVNPETREYNFEKLHYVTKRITKNLNRVIDENYYPVPEAKVSNLRHRPIGIGVQGLADAF